MVGSVSGPAIGMLGYCGVSPMLKSKAKKTDHFDRTVYWWHYRHICSVAYNLLATIWNDPTWTHHVSSFRAKYTGKEESHSIRPALEALHCSRHVQSFTDLPSICLPQRVSCCEYSPYMVL